MANHKRRKGRAFRGAFASGHVMCKWEKYPPVKKSDKRKAERDAFRHEEAGG